MRASVLDDRLGLLTSVAALFQRHQEALLSWDVEEALVTLDRILLLCHQHVADEEERLLPPYEERCRPARPGRGERFRKEHRELSELLRQIRKTLLSMRSAGKNLLPVLIPLLDREAEFKRIFKIHQRRTERLLFPALEQLRRRETRA